MEFTEQYGPWAVIVGGSEGIGSAFAEDLAGKGVNLLLVARTASKLEALAQGLKDRHPGRDVRFVATDMTSDAGADAVLAATEGLEVGLLIYNAGACARRCNFVDMDLAFNLGQVTLNVTNKMKLTYALAGKMRDRGRGGVMLLGSAAASAGAPGFCTYSGVKAFNALFSEGLWHELRPFGVHVLGYIVTFVDTPTLGRDFPEVAGLGADPVVVAKHGLTLLADGPTGYSPGAEVRVPAMQALPRREAVEAAFAGMEGKFKMWSPQSDVA